MITVSGNVLFPVLAAIALEGFFIFFLLRKNASDRKYAEDIDGRLNALTQEVEKLKNKGE